MQQKSANLKLLLIKKKKDFLVPPPKKKNPHNFGARTWYGAVQAGFDRTKNIKSGKKLRLKLKILWEYKKCEGFINVAISHFQYFITCKCTKELICT